MIHRPAERGGDPSFRVCIEGGPVAVDGHACESVEATLVEQ